MSIERAKALAAYPAEWAIEYLQTHPKIDELLEEVRDLEKGKRMKKWKAKQ